MKQTGTKQTNGETSLAVVPIEEYQALQNEAEELTSLIEEYLSDGLTESDLYLIKVPSGGGRAFDMPNDAVESTFSGIILGVQSTRVYYPHEFTGAGEQPACSSRDGIVGEGNPGGACSGCPMAKWGSARTGRGQACAQYKILYILRPEDVLPVRLRLPAGSFPNFRKYQMMLLNKRVRQSAVATVFGLTKAENKGGITFSQATFSLAGGLSKEVAERAKAYAALLNASMSNKPIEDPHALAVNPDLDEGDMLPDFDARDTEQKAPF